MTDPTPTELIDEIRGWAKSRENWSHYQFDLGKRAADALEAQLAETARLQAVIDKVREGVSARLDKDWDETQLIGTPVWNALDWIDHELAEEREKSARAAGSSSALEAVKADTTTEWGVRIHGRDRVRQFNSERLAKERIGFPLSSDLGKQHILVSRKKTVAEWLPVETEGERR